MVGNCVGGWVAAFGWLEVEAWWKADSGILDAAEGVHDRLRRVQSSGQMGG